MLYSAEWTRHKLLEGPKDCISTRWNQIISTHGLLRDKLLIMEIIQLHKEANTLPLLTQAHLKLLSLRHFLTASRLNGNNLFPILTVQAMKFSVSFRILAQTLKKNCNQLVSSFQELSMNSLQTNTLSVVVRTSVSWKYIKTTYQTKTQTCSWWVTYFWNTFTLCLILTTTPLV